jgi:hypothetical protein
MENNIIRRFPIYKSRVVDDGALHDHKLWWADIIQTPDGRYQLITYAQLFAINLKDKIIEGEQIRRYECGTFLTLDNAEAKYKQKLRVKLSDRKGYETFKDRTESTGINLSEEIINEFLKKYGGSSVLH